MDDKTKKVLIAIVQALVVLCIFIYFLYFLDLGQEVSPIFLYFFPLVASLLIAFVFGVFIPMEINFKTASWISVPMTVVYIFLYAVIPQVHQFDYFHFVICGFILPISLAGLFLNALAIWLGALLHKKVFKGKKALDIN